jgi:hypothetical protein
MSNDAALADDKELTQGTYANKMGVHEPLAQI